MSKKKKKFETQAVLLSKPETWDYFFKIVAAGESARAAAAYVGLTVNAINAYVNRDEVLSQRYAEARQARADFHGERIEKIANDVETGDMDAAAGRVSLEARKYLARVYDADRWGDRQRVDLNVTDVNALHLEALRALNKREKVIDIDAQAIIES